MSDGLIGKRIKVDLGGKQRTLIFDFNGMCKAEEVTGLNLFFGFDVNAWSSARVLRALVWAGLLHESPNLKIETVGDWLGDGPPSRILSHLMSAWVESMPNEDELDIDPEEGKDDAPFVETGPS